MTPGIAGLCQTVAEQVRGRTGFDDKSTLLTAEEIRANLEIQRFLRDHKRESDREALSASEASAAGRLATQIRFMTKWRDFLRILRYWLWQILLFGTPIPCVDCGTSS